MEWWLVLLLSIGGLIVLLCLNVPVAIAFLAVDIVGLLILAGMKGLGLITASIFESVGSITLGAIPLFYLLGEVLFQSKAVNIILDTVDKWIGNFRARLNIVGIGVGTVLGALSGAAMADAAVLAATLLPEMLKRGYDKKLSIGSIMCSGSLAAIIPPSVLAVLIGSLASVSISALLIAGIMPGLLLAGLFFAYVMIRVRLNPSLAPKYPTTDVTVEGKMLFFTEDITVFDHCGVGFGPHISRYSNAYRVRSHGYDGRHPGGGPVPEAQLQRVGKVGAVHHTAERDDLLYRGRFEGFQPVSRSERGHTGVARCGGER